MKLAALLLACCALTSCESMLRRDPSSNIPVAVRLAINKSPQFGLEDQLTRTVRDEALKEGRFPIVSEDKAERIILVIIQHYLVVPTQYDSSLSPLAYKLSIGVDLQLLDKTGKIVIWQEKDMDGVQTYAPTSTPGGLDEPGAQALIWDSLSRDIVDRVAQGLSARVPGQKNGP